MAGGAGKEGAEGERGGDAVAVHSRVDLYMDCDAPTVCHVDDVLKFGRGGDCDYRARVDCGVWVGACAKEEDWAREAEVAEGLGFVYRGNGEKVDLLRDFRGNLGKAEAIGIAFDDGAKARATRQFGADCANIARYRFEIYAKHCIIMYENYWRAVTGQGFGVGKRWRDPADDRPSEGKCVQYFGKFGAIWGGNACS